MKTIRSKYYGLVAAVLALVFTSSSQAASVREVTVDEMLQQSQLVFEGTVTASAAKENDQKRIHTYLTFAVAEVIKGVYPYPTVTLSFLGGTVGKITMAVSDMVLPQVGEHGIYFVESLDRSQIQPLYGWSQGHFVVEPDATGTDRVMTNRRQPVMAVLGGIPPAAAASTKGASQGLSKGVASDLAVGGEGSDVPALTPAEFKKALREKLGGVR